MSGGGESARAPGRGGGGLIGVFARHPNAANLLMALMLLLGVFGLLRINTQFFPTISINRITVAVIWPGASAEDVAGNILDLIEPEVRFVDGVEETESVAREGAANITLIFGDGADMQRALADVEQAVASVTTLPVDAETPTVSRFQGFDNVAKIALSGPFSEAALNQFARTVRDKLIDAGVDKVSFDGARDTEYVVETDVADLRRLGLTVGDVADRIGRNSRDTPSGALDGDLERQIRMLADAETPQSIGRIEVVATETGEKVRVRDLAVVEVRADEDDSRGFVGGQPAVELLVERAPEADTLEMERNMRAGLAAARAELPASLELQVYQVRADRVAERIGLLVKNGLTGLVLVVLILFVFLNAKIALWVAAGVPVALMTTIGLMYLSGQSVNMISLFALIMTLGIIVDDAIVVGEHTATRLAEGDDAETAAINGASIMFAPVIAAMATTVAAFAPILLISEEIGQIMSQLPFVAIAVLIASLVECFLVLPGHLAHALRRDRPARVSLLAAALIAAPPAAFLAMLAASEGFAAGVGLGGLHPALAAAAAAIAPAPFPLAAALGFWALAILGLALAARARARARPGRGFRARFDAGFAALRDRLLRPLVRLCVRFPYATVAISAASLILALGLVRGDRIPFVFFPSPEAENITASITFESGLPEAESLAAIAQVEAALRDVERRLAPPGEPLVRAVFTELGDSLFSPGDNLALIEVELTASEARSVRTPDIVAAWRAAAPELPGMKRVAISKARFGPPGRDFDIRLSGASAQALKAASLELQEALKRYPGVTGVDDDLPFGKPELALSLTPKGAALGFTVDEIGRQVRDAVEGRIARRIPAPGEEIVVRVKARAPEGAGGLQALELRAPSGAFAPLSEIAAFTERQGFSTIRRRDGAATVSVVADVDSAVTTSGKIQEDLVDSGEAARIAERHGVSYRFAGRAEERATAFADLQLGLLVALTAIYIILAWIFAHYARPAAVMTIIPFGLVGALLGHWIMGFPLTILSLIGLLGLTGILVNDSIILVARFIERLKAGEAFETAAVGASCDRLRAILLTSLTTVAGLAPLLFETSLQAQFLMPMVITIVYGLSFATLFVLFLIPAILAIGEDLARLLGAPRRAAPAPAE